MIKKHTRVTVLFSLLLLLPVALTAQQKPGYMWFDAEANFVRLSYPDSIAFYMKKLKALGFTDVVADVKAITGETLYPGRYAPVMTEWNGFSRPDGYDMLGIFISEAHKAGLRAHASLNVFCGGHLYIDRGIIFSDHPEWQAQVYTPEGVAPITKVRPNYNGMLNPALPAVREYELNILKEVVELYPDLDGVILDRVRFDGITSDFSRESCELFERYAGFAVENYPEDILSWEKDKNGAPKWRPGKYFNKWIEWRASLVYTFIEEVRNSLKKINPDISISDYAGSWYPVYYEVGVNWASQKYDPSKDYEWATEKYKEYGYAELLDELQVGLYYTEVTIGEVNRRNEESMKGRDEAAMGLGKDYWYSVEGSARLSKQVTCNAIPVIGSIYVDMYNDKKQFSDALQMALRETDGLMVFDIVHIIKKDWWDALKCGMDNNGTVR